MNKKKSSIRNISNMFLYRMISLVCAIMLAFGLYLQIELELVPCPMCIVQRYAIIGIFVMTIILQIKQFETKKWWATAPLFFSVIGAFVAAKQSWLQWYPPEFTTCGRDFYGMIENLPIRDAIPSIFKGSGDCSAIDWTFLGGSIANWSFISFAAISIILISIIFRKIN